jgi:MFS family permease
VNKEADEHRGMITGSGGAGGGRRRISLRNLKTFESFKIPAYRLFYGAMAGQWASMNMQMVTRSLLVYRITGSGAILGGMAMANAVPLLLLSLLGGAIADRMQKKYIMVYGQVGSAVLSLGIAIALTVGYLGPERPDTWWLLVITALFQGGIMGFMMPARSAIVPEIVGMERVMNATSLGMVGMNTFRLVGPALAGFLIDAVDFAAVYYIMSGMYLMATVCAVFLPRTRAITVRRSSSLMDIFEGLRYIRHETILLLILVLVFVVTIFGTPFQQLMPMFTEDILKVSATGLGILMSVSGIGAMCGSLVLASMPNRKRGRLLLLSGLIMALALVCFSFSHWWYLSLVLIIFIGLGQSWQMTLSLSLLQYYTDADYLGRVMSFRWMEVGFSSLGTFFTGVLSETIGVQWAIGGFAMALVLVSFMALLFMPRLRKLD